MPSSPIGPASSSKPRPGYKYNVFPSLFILHTLHPALEDGTDRGLRNVGKLQSDAGEIPKRIHTIFKTRRKSEIKDRDCVTPLSKFSWSHVHNTSNSTRFTSVFECLHISKLCTSFEGRNTIVFLLLFSYQQAYNSITSFKLPTNSHTRLLCSITFQNYLAFILQ